MKKIKILLLIFCLFFFGFYYNETNAFSFYRTDLTASVFGVIGGVSNFFSFFTETVIGKVRNDFCGNYFSSLASGEWKSDEFRVSLGSKICTEGVAIKIDEADKKKIQILPESKASKEGVAATSTSFKIETKTTSITKQQPVSKKVETSGVLVNNSQTAGAKINGLQIVSLTNVERIKIGLKPLVENQKLDLIAEERVDDMFAKGYFEHISPTGDSASLVADRKGYKYIVIGENIALGNFENTQALINAWMNSEGHKKNILHTSYTEIGIYAKEGIYKGQKVWISAQIFARPLSSCVEPGVRSKEKIQSIQNSLNDMKKRVGEIALGLPTINTAENPNLYNAKLAEYNLLVSMINSLVKELNSLVAVYNTEVRVFNECIK